MAWHGRGMVWHGMVGVWYGMTWHGMASEIEEHRD